MMKYTEIEISSGNKVTIDTEDLELVSQRHWHLDGAGYARTNVWADGKKQSAPRMHRLILGVTNRKLHVDHINGDKLDNRKDNLRVCTCSQNVMNRGKQLNNSSGYKGVIYDKERSKWRAEIAFNGKRKYLGRFDTVEEAALAYNKSALEHHGEYAYLNEFE